MVIFGYFMISVFSLFGVSHSVRPFIFPLLAGRIMYKFGAINRYAKVPVFKKYSNFILQLR